MQRPNPFARKTSGSYYTPEDLVLLIIARTLGPLIDERRQAFRDLPARADAAALDAADPASRILDLTVLDPAMGSGHFLVSLVDWLADRVLEAMAEAQALRPDHPSPLVARLEAIAAHIAAEADRHGWTLPIGGLEPRQLVRRIILKRVIHGVDKNPMAVELAKLSLWLHTFTVGAPLSFLDHHLRVGDSLFGEWVRDAQDFMAERGGMMAGALTTGARRSARAMLAIEAMSDADIQEVHASAESFAGVEEATAPLNAILGLVQAWRWLGADKQKTKPSSSVIPALSRDPASFVGKGRGDKGARTPAAVFNAILDGSEGDTAAIASGTAEPRNDDARALAAELRAIAAREQFLHWQVAFPNRWDAWQEQQPVGGFDAVIGNPPWDRIKLQQVEWFAARVPEIARSQRAADRKRAVARLVERGGDLADGYAQAAAKAEGSARLARAGYPLLGGGDANLYSLFVERADQLVKPGGAVGLLTPSGIAGDLGAARFFRSVSTTGRLGGVYDFENRTRGGDKLWFPDVDSRFKFCALIFGGRERRFDTAALGFFLPGASDADLARSTFPLGADDFARVNPNTGTAPVFRTARDADLVLGIYRRLPVLVDRRADPPVQAWPVRYLRMFDMTNDSGLFRTRAELEASCYPVAGNRWRGSPPPLGGRGDGGGGPTEYVPLYEGKMVQAFDHRAASVEINAANVHRPAQPVETTPMEHVDPDWLPQPQFWVDAKACGAVAREPWVLGFKEITASTNVRTTIAAALPAVGFGNTLPVLTRTTADARLELLLANLNSFAFDYVARQKVQGNHLNWYIVEQLPVIPPAAYTRRFGPRTAAEIVRADVLALTYTAHDMAPFARDLGHHGPPFRWDEDDRRTRRARLDALYFHLYGLGREDADYILSTFPIVERQDRAAHGRYLTRDLILAWMNALAAGEPDATIVLPRA